MASKYIIEMAGFNGDGTTSAEASIAGGVGAWNHVDIIAGTAVGFGTLVAGDVVYIRSKTGAGLNLNITYNPGASKSFGSTAGTSALPITWILDNGTVWSGINGTLTLTSPSNLVTQTFINFNDFISNTPYNFVVENTGPNPSFNNPLFQQCNTYGLKLNFPNTITSGWNVLFTTTAVLSPVPKHTSMYIYMAGMNTGNPPIQIQYGKVLFINPTIEVPTVPGAASFLFAASKIDIRGGRIFGAGIDSGLIAVLQSSGVYSTTTFLNFIGTQVPKIAPIVRTQLPSGSMASLSGLDGGSAGAVTLEWGDADSRNISNNYPTLNATLADSVNTPSSWRLYPKYANRQTPFEMPIAKLYTGTPATKIITFNFLATTTWTGSIAPNLSNVWMDVTYIDNATGLPVYQTTKVDIGGGALTTSGLTWTPSNAWGAVSMTAYKLVLTTTASIKQNTTVNISFVGYTTSGNANDIYIFCPDVQLT